MTTEPNTATPLLSDFPLHPALLEAALTMGFKNATPVQAQAIPEILQRRDVMVSAATGSGKTAAFLLPALHLILNSSTRGSRILILLPTRELAQQVADQCKQISALTRLRSGLIIGGEDFKKQQKYLIKQYDIIIATPGRLLEQLEQMPHAFRNLETLILDEADRMLDMGFIPDILKIAETCQSRKQTLLFSATLSHPAILRMTESLLKDPVSVSLSTVYDLHEDIQQQVIPCDDIPHKRQVLIWLLSNEQYDKAIIFTNTKIQAEQLRGPLRAQKLRVEVLHGDMDQDARNRVMNLYREGTINLLITTDIAGRGLDIKGIELVVNFDMPRTAHHYVHRIGRTGRIGEKGLAISLVHSNEWNLMVSIEHYLKQHFARRSLKAVPSNFNGPKKLKASGKAVGAKEKALSKKAEVKKVKVRERVTKNIGKRRKPAGSHKLTQETTQAITTSIESDVTT